MLEAVCLAYKQNLAPHFPYLIPKLTRLAEGSPDIDQAKYLYILTELVVTKHQGLLRALNDLRPFPDTPPFQALYDFHKDHVANNVIVADSDLFFSEVRSLLAESPENLRIGDIKHLRRQLAAHPPSTSDRYLTTLIRKHLVKRCHHARNTLSKASPDPIISEISRFLGEFGAGERAGA